LERLSQKFGVPHKMNRNRWLLLAIALLMIGNFIWYGWLHWGLITVHAKEPVGLPLSKVIQQIESQGHVTIKTNIDGSTPVHMWVTNVTLADALETLAAVTDSRWRLAFFVAPDKTSIKGALANLSSGQKMEGWKSVYYPLMMPRADGGEDEVPADPRKDPWNVKPVDQKTAQAYLEQAARSVSASFNFPESWNPPVNSTLKSGPIESTLPKLASAAKGKYEEVFLLQKGGRRGGRERRSGEDEGPRLVSNDDEGGGGGPRFGGGFNREGMEARMQSELDKMPADRRAALQKEMDDRRAFFNSLKDLPKDQRDARLAEYFSQPDVQAAMDNQQANRDSRNSPQQRANNANNYLARKAAASGGAKP